MKAMASFTVRIFSAASSGISQPHSSSKATTSCAVARLSAPRSSMKLAPSFTFDASTPRCSTTIFFTRSAISPMVLQPSTELVRRHPQGGPKKKRRPLNIVRAALTSPPREPAPTPLYHCHSTIDMQGLPGDVGRLLARQVEHRRAHVLGPAQALHRDQLQQ